MLAVEWFHKANGVCIYIHVCACVFESYREKAKSLLVKLQINRGPRP